MQPYVLSGLGSTSFDRYALGYPIIQKTGWPKYIFPKLLINPPWKLYISCTPAKSNECAINNVGTILI